MSNIVNLHGKEIKHIPEEHVAGILVHLTGAVSCLLANHDIFKSLVEQCDTLKIEELKKLIVQNSQGSLDGLDVDDLVEQLITLMKIYKHISPILSLYTKNIIKEEEEKIFTPGNGITN